MAAAKPRVPVFGAQQKAREATPDGKSKKAGRRKGWGAPVAPGGGGREEEGDVAAGLGRSEEEEWLTGASCVAQGLLLRVFHFIKALEVHCMLEIEAAWQELEKTAQVSRRSLVTGESPSVIKRHSICANVTLPPWQSVSSPVAWWCFPSQ